ncbi:MAG: hypothetical protein EZS28_002286, partial [Streblomastix strix]
MNDLGSKLGEKSAQTEQIAQLLEKTQTEKSSVEKNMRQQYASREKAIEGVKMHLIRLQAYIEDPQNNAIDDNAIEQMRQVLAADTPAALAALAVEDNQALFPYSIGDLNILNQKKEKKQQNGDQDNEDRNYTEEDEDDEDEDIQWDYNKQKQSNSNIQSVSDMDRYSIIDKEDDTIEQEAATASDGQQLKQGKKKGRKGLNTKLSSYPSQVSRQDSQLIIQVPKKRKKQNKQSPNDVQNAILDQTPRQQKDKEKDKNIIKNKDKQKSAQLTYIVPPTPQKQTSKKDFKDNQKQKATSPILGQQRDKQKDKQKVSKLKQKNKKDGESNEDKLSNQIISISPSTAQLDNQDQEQQNTEQEQEQEQDDNEQQEQQQQQEEQKDESKMTITEIWLKRKKDLEDWNQEMEKKKKEREIEVKETPVLTGKKKLKHLQSNLTISTSKGNLLKRQQSSLFKSKFKDGQTPNSLSSFRQGQQFSTSKKQESKDQFDDNNSNSNQYSPQKLEQQKQQQYDRDFDEEEDYDNKGIQQWKGEEVTGLGSDLLDGILSQGTGAGIFGTKLRNSQSAQTQGIGDRKLIGSVALPGSDEYIQQQLKLQYLDQNQQSIQFGGSQQELLGKKIDINEELLKQRLNNEKRDSLSEEIKEEEKIKQAPPMSRSEQRAAERRARIAEQGKKENVKEK